MDENDQTKASARFLSNCKQLRLKWHDLKKHFALAVEKFLTQNTECTAHFLEKCTYDVQLAVHCGFYGELKQVPGISPDREGAGF